MIFRTPDYYSDFRCIADKCRDNCCIGWEIDIDEETAAYYDSVGGDFGKRLHRNISEGCFALDEKERCPFLNGRNLCDIYTTLGEEHLCQICTDHPRYYEWFGSIKEGGVGLCCEAAAELMLSRDMTIVESNTDEEPAESPDMEIFELLDNERNELIQLIAMNELPEALRLALDCAERRQSIIDMDNWEAADIQFEEIPAEEADPEGILRFLCTLEPMSPDWIPRLERCIRLLPKIGAIPAEDFPELRRIANYFLFRYYLKSVFDLDVLSRVKLSAVCTWVISLLWRCRRAETGKCSFDDKVLDAKSLSKEIEYNEENLETFLDASYELDCLKTASLKGLFC